MPGEPLTKLAFVPRAITTTTRGRIVGWEPGAGISVDIEGHGVRLAQSVVTLSEAELDRAVAAGVEALLTFEDGDRGSPVILGLLAPIPMRTAPADAAEGEEIVLIRGRDSLQLRCGSASITLRKDGKIVLRGTEILSRATKSNRISGGTVHLN